MFHTSSQSKALPTSTWRKSETERTRLMAAVAQGTALGEKGERG